MRKIITSVVLCVLGLGCAVAAAQTITKCQDADGKWHYGDFAADECNASISELSEGGTTLNEISAPPTQEELDALAEARKVAARESEQAEQKAALDQQLLNIYENEDSIIRTRDTRLAAIDRTIQSAKELKSYLEGKLSALDGEKNPQAKAEIAALSDQIDEYARSIRDRLEERNRIHQRFQSDLERFRAITQKTQ